MSYYDKQVDFHSLIGQTITELSTGDDTHITTNTGKYIIFHSQDCCERVGLEKVIGNIDDVLNSPITLAEEDSQDPDWYTEKFWESHTWSAFYLETEKGRVELWFLGQSNGYYGESMTFAKAD